MAIISGMFNSINGDRRYNASWFARYFATFIGNGVFPNPSTGLQVLEGKNMTTTVKAGDGWINGYFITNDSDYILQHDLADGVLKRIDRVVMRLNYLSRQIEIDVKKGTLAGSPVAPSLQRDADAYELGLADVLINNGATQITQANIKDLRLNTAFCGIVHGTVEQVDTTAIYNQYQASLDKYMEFVQDCIDGTTVANINQSISVINNRTAINLFDVNKVGFVRCTGSISGNKITGTVTSTAKYAYTVLVLTTLKKNTCYTLSYKSSRQGDSGGGYQILGWKDNVTKTIATSLNAINGSVTFNTGSDGDYDKIQINLVFAVKNQSVSPITASFWDITLVEGTQPAEYVPYVGNYNTIVDYVAAEDIDEHKAKGVSQKEGVHGIRFINKNLEYFDVETQGWRPASPPALTIYGVEIDESNPNPETSVTYTDDATGFTPSSGNNGNFSWGSWESIVKDEFRIRPVMLENKAPRLGPIEVNYPLQYDNYTKREDGRNSDLTGIDGDVMIEFGRPLWWKFTRAGDKLKIQLSSKEFDGAIKPAFEIEDGYNQVPIYPLFLTQILYLLMFRNLDSQTALGRGNTDGSANYLNTGGTNTKTFNYGETTGRLQMKFLGMEDFWGNRRWWIDGFSFDSLLNIWIGKEGFNNTGEGYENFGIAGGSEFSGFIDKVQGGNNTGFIPASASGSETTYYSDYGSLYHGRQANFGGASGAGGSAGGFSLYSAAASDSSVAIGGRLFYSRNGKIYIGAYLGVKEYGRLRSISGQASHSNATIDEFRNLARDNNEW